MEANEIKKGNWYRTEYETQCGMVIGTGFFDDETISDVFKRKNFNDYQPIPLTPEILEKCGFDRKGDIYDKENCSADLCFRLTDGVLVPSPYYTGQPMTKEAWPKHLHQLQNLYFALTGQELTVNL